MNLQILPFQHYNIILEYAIIKCLNLIGQCEGSESLRATVRGLYMSTPPAIEAAFATKMLFMDTSNDKNTNC